MEAVFQNRETIQHEERVVPGFKKKQNNSNCCKKQVVFFCFVFFVQMTAKVAATSSFLFSFLSSKLLSVGKSTHCQ